MKDIWEFFFDSCNLSKITPHDMNFKIKLYRNIRMRKTGWEK